MNKNIFITVHILPLKYKYINNVYQLVNKYRRMYNSIPWEKCVLMLYFCIC